MKAQKLELGTEEFDEIIEDIKQKNLSRNHMPKLVVGTGLSICYGVPGMSALATYLNRKIVSSKDDSLIDMWKMHYPVIKKNGLEAGLANLRQEEMVLVDKIKEYTAGYILKKEEEMHDDIYNSEKGFSKLLRYLSRTVSYNYRVIDIMTPNYDRIIELLCDKLGLGVITGFFGSTYCQFNREILNTPTTFYNCKENTWVRIFKPHGSINWVHEDKTEYLTNNYNVLKDKTKYIEIVTPGSLKHREGMINNTFRCMREDFNTILRSERDYSLFIYGYGFNDEHFDIAIEDSFDRNVLILAKDVKAEIIQMAIDNKNITIFYSESKKDYMIYKSRKYLVDAPLWNIDVFAETFLG